MYNDKKHTVSKYLQIKHDFIKIFIFSKKFWWFRWYPQHNMVKNTWKSQFQIDYFLKQISIVTWGHFGISRQTYTKMFLTYF